MRIKMDNTKLKIVDKSALFKGKKINNPVSTGFKMENEQRRSK